VFPWFLNGRFEEGLPDLEHALTLDPDNYFIHWHIGYAYAAVGQLDKAATHAAFLASVGPDMPYTEQLLALVDALENRPQQAIDRISAVDVAPLDGHTTFHLAEPLMVAGAKEQALDLLETGSRSPGGRCRKRILSLPFFRRVLSIHGVASFRATLRENPG
jgi:thioredoxin-like negative regulator of GroEL